ncbi:MAG TPA: anaerobic ribonucleoside-triphosphate reductase activating protein [Syntrophales bacterium]|jgi:pyruvate formate lyase activating enzyme|nr:anaerobic ribonucleoside-triphosphate reductase activating protein [Syntrophales bacterium]HOU78491.1 anaerobic ribonucleoside-triphosphate reductase activating protein [Syntrophales bacterium]HPC32242.1 anaerobic ribonucleoside-triphosphate reductase activating protein [Syntrophales bacterium]HQG34854.1 anaerobic ribonucleoside-triphosphate reductase activating protein [Syntrophales bacterium]HQI36719.1 anaerobic ribonucleoside-triphosphate reductase activating protein [Syntrophales bacteri
MKIGGFQKFSLIDYPGMISAVVFTQGCNFRCPYCHNPELVDPRRFGATIPAGDILEFLAGRRGKLDAVVVTGGEPTMQGDLFEFMKDIKAMGFLVKLDTNGSAPVVLARLLAAGLVDYVAMDLKGPLDRYPAIVRTDVKTDDIERSVSLITGSGIGHEFRTTLVPSLLTAGDVLAMADLVKAAPKYVLQRFIPGKMLDSRTAGKACFSGREIVSLKARLEKRLSCVAVR